MTERMEGSYALAILTKEKIFVARGCDGHETLAIGTKQGAVAVCSESNSFYNQGFKMSRDIEAGEMVVLNKGNLESLGIIKTKKKIRHQPCSFKWVYTSFPTSVHFGISAAEVRRKLGARSAVRDIKEGFIPDIVAPVPDSGRFHAIGYIQEFIRQMNEGKIKKIPFYDEVLLKYTYASRSYTPADPRIRDIEAVKKIIPNTDNNYKGKVIVIVDDSIVRGTQSRNDLIPKIRAIGVSEIHFRVANSKLVSTCLWGKSNKKKKELGAYSVEKGRIRTDEEMAEMLGIDSCKFNLSEDLAKAIGIPMEDLCTDCSQLIV